MAQTRADQQLCVKQSRQVGFVVYVRAVNHTNVAGLLAFKPKCPPVGRGEDKDGLLARLAAVQTAIDDAQAALDLEEPPTAPTNLAVSSKTTSSVSFTWTASTDNVGVTGYVVQMKQGSGSFAVVGEPSTTSFTKSGLSASTTYIFRVKAVDAVDNASDWSDELSVTTNAASSSGGGGVPVTGTAVSTSGGTVTELGATIVIPANAVTSTIRVRVVKVTDTSGLPMPAKSKLVSDVLDITKDISGDFKKPVTVTLAFDKTKVDTDKEAVSIYWFDAKADKWVELDKVKVDLTAGKVSGEVDHFTRFAVIAAEKAPVVPEKVKKAVKLTIGQTYATVDGISYILDAVPFVKAGVNRTLVPVRFVSEALGAKVDWKAQTRQVVIKDGGTEIVLAIGSDKVMVNGVEKALDCPAEIVGSRTFVPLRFVSETLGAKVDYSATTKQITITR